MTKQPLGAIVRDAMPFIVMAICRARDHHHSFRTSILWLPRLWGYKG